MGQGGTQMTQVEQTIQQPKMKFQFVAANMQSLFVACKRLAPKRKWQMFQRVGKKYKWPF